eukprot:scaffold2795_cov428-Pinguiococcus_pyrenoidosus.AAC.7
MKITSNIDERQHNVDGVLRTPRTEHTPMVALNLPPSVPGASESRPVYCGHASSRVAPNHTSCEVLSLRILHPMLLEESGNSRSRTITAHDLRAPHRS